MHPHAPAEPPDPPPVRILHLEDMPPDAELIHESLRRDLKSCLIEWVRGRADYETALLERAFDVVLSDYQLPGYNGLEALRFALEHRPDLPVILISGTLSEAEAVACVKAGATDYVLKDRLERLGPAVERARVEAAERRARTRIEAALQRSEARLRLSLQVSQISVWDYDTASGRVAYSSSLGAILGYDSDEVAALSEAWETLVHPEDLRRLRIALARHYRGRSPGVDIEYRIRASNGEWRWLHTIARAVQHDADGHAVRMSGTHQDVTVRRQAEEMLRLHESAMAAATNAILIVDARAPDRPIVHVNRAFERITGYAAAEVLGRNCRFLQGTDRDQPALEELRRAIAAGTEASVLMRNYRKDGTLFWNKLSISPVRSAAGVVSHYVGVQSDVTELKNYQVELEYRATHDTLTGLANRNLLDDRLSYAVAVAQRAQRRFVVLYLGLERFESVNDSLGHASGDVLLKTVAVRLKNAVRHSDTVARLGNAEFAIVLTEVGQPAPAASLAQKLLGDIAQMVPIGSHEVFTAASVGICVFPEDGADADALLKNAATAMYRARSAGGGHVYFYTEDLNAGAMERLRLEADLRRAATGEEFELHYQPRVDLATGAITSVEALVRWRHAEGLISPARFIPLAEETGLIVPIGLWVLRTACAQMRRWRDEGHAELRVAVNLSPRQFRQADLVECIESILADYGLAAQCLELEITEGVAMQDPSSTQPLLERLSAMGVSIAIDDFGTGYSSLAYLKQFPLDYLKIDQSFVRGLPGSVRDEHLVRSIIALAHNLELGVIGEGVETEVQRASLRAWGCDEAQGFLLCRPLPAAQLVDILKAPISAPFTRPAREPPISP